LFLATGAAWYYSPAGAREWRFLSAKTDTIDGLLLGDFDKDGRTDVVGMNPSGQFDVSWGGISDWEVINKNPCLQGDPDVPKPCPKSIQNMVVGDFDGDGTPDIFYADGKKNWYISYGGTKPFKKVNDSSFPVQALRFGHFSVCGMGKETDVFGIVSGKWMVTCGALGPWIPLHVSLTNKIDGLVVADFDGDGIADVATNDHNDWMISYGGVSAWKHYNVPDTDKCASPEPTLPLMPGIGHFARNLGADVLLWDRNGGREFCIAAGGNAATKVGWTSGLQPYSTQDMR
jgi:FG-GAP-like repeat